jgi:hypothetical protein
MRDVISERNIKTEMIINILKNAMKDGLLAALFVTFD